MIETLSKIDLTKKIESRVLDSSIHLISSSTETANYLTQIGFKNITPVLLPDTETILHKERTRTTINEPNATLIAKSKLEYALRNFNIPESSFVISYGFSPIYFIKTNDLTVEKEMTYPIDLDQFRSFNLFLFHNILSENEIFSQKISRLDRVNFNTALQIYRLYESESKQRLIGIDASFCMKKKMAADIYTYSGFRNYLRLDTLLGAKESSNSPDQIIDNIFEKSISSGINPLNILGGIDYSNQGIIDLLKITDLNAINNNGLYKGFPLSSFIKFLSNPLDNKVF